MASKNTTRVKSTPTISTIIGGKEKKENIIEVKKKGSKGKTKEKKYYIVITHSKESHLTYTVFIINQTKELLRLKQRFGLAELRVVDFLANDDTRLDFLLVFNGDINYHFHADDWQKKKKFLIGLWKLCKNILPKEGLPSFKNVNTQMLAESVYLSATLKGMEDVQGEAPHAESVEHEYKYLTKEEEIDLEAITEQCQWETENAEAFISKLTMELSGLDKANIHSIMNVEAEVMKLFTTMDEATKQLDLLDQKLEHYSKLLDKEESRIIDISHVSNSQSTRTINNNKLLEISKGLLELLSMPCNLEDLDTLNDHNLESFSETVALVQERVDVLAQHELREMTCVKDTVEYCHNFLKSVPNLLYAELTEKFQRDWQSKHRARHYNIARFSSLLNWCREFHHAIYNDIFQSYEVSIKKCYEKEIVNFFKDKIGSIQKRSNVDKGFSFAGKASAQSVIDITASQRNIKEYRGSIGSVDSLHTRGSGDSMAQFQQQNEQFSKFDGLFTQVLDFITPLVIDEEDHLDKVFGIPYMVDIPPNATDEDVRYLKEQNTKANNILLKLFGSKLEQELRNLIEVSYKVDNYYSLFMYLRLSKQSYSRDNSVFLTRFFSSSLIIVKRHFEQFINIQVAQISDMKASKNKKCGILPCVHKFGFFIRDTERIFDVKERRTEIEKGYASLLHAIFTAVDRISKEQQRVPPEVVVFENYHHVNELLKTMNIASLGEIHKKALKIYEKNLEEYVTVKLGSPMEKISEFFMGVKQALGSTVRAEEVGFQIKYSRGVLKSLLKQCHLKDVKKSVEHVLSKMDKQLCTEEAMFALVAGIYCNNIISQLTEYEDLLKQCYPDSGLGFEFRKEEISRIFES